MLQEPLLPQAVRGPADKVGRHICGTDSHDHVIVGLGCGPVFGAGWDHPASPRPVDQVPDLSALKGLETLVRTIGGEARGGPRGWSWQGNIVAVTARGDLGAKVIAPPVQRTRVRGGLYQQLPLTEGRCGLPVDLVELFP